MDERLLKYPLIKTKENMRKFIFMAIAVIAVMLQSCAPSTNSYEYYVGTWKTSSDKISVTFKTDGTASCKFTMGSYPVEYTTDWEVSEGTGVVFGTMVSGEYKVMRPDGHLYHYNSYTDKRTDEEVYLKKQ